MGHHNRTTVAQGVKAMASSTFHRGAFLRMKLKERHIKVSSLARSIGIALTSFPSYFESQVLNDDVLMRITDALGWDLLGELKSAEFQQAKQLGENQLAEEISVGNPSGAVSATGGKAELGTGRPGGLQLLIHLDVFSDEVQADILRFLNSLPRRNTNRF